MNFASNLLFLTHEKLLQHLFIWIAAIIHSCIVFHYGYPTVSPQLKKVYKFPYIILSYLYRFDIHILQIKKADQSISAPAGNIQNSLFTYAYLFYCSIQKSHFKVPFIICNDSLKHQILHVLAQPIVLALPQSAFSSVA